MQDAFICDGIRTPIGRYGGTLSHVRTDDLGAIPLRELMARNPNLDWSQVDDVIYGCANQAGEDNRNVAHMSSLLAGLPVSVPGTTIGWRFVNQQMQKQFGVDSMPETAENVAERFNISREDQDTFACRSQQRYQQAKEKGRFAAEIVPVSIPQRKAAPVIFDTDEHPRLSTIETLARLPAPFREGGSVTAGNASGVNDGAAALLIANQKVIDEQNLQPRARVLGMAVVGLEPAIMGFGPAPATRKVLQQVGLTLDQMDVIELNEAFASQALAVLRDLGLPDDAEHVNPNGGAIALGHPLGMSGARIVLTAIEQLHQSGGRYALCTMCIGVGQGIAMVVEKV